VLLNHELGGFLMAQMNLLGIAQNENDVVYTPGDVAMDIVSHFQPSGKCLEPSKGDGAFYKYLPEGSDYCEIKEGKDFFAYNEKVDWIVGNPPYSIFFEWLMHSFEIAENVVYLLPVGKVFNAFRMFKAIRKYGGIKEIYLLGTGHDVGFDIGFAVAAIHFQRNFNGGILVTFRDAAEQPLALDGGGLAPTRRKRVPLKRDNTRRESRSHPHRQ
jgi:hypothetical protein